MSRFFHSLSLVLLLWPAVGSAQQPHVFLSDEAPRHHAPPLDDITERNIRQDPPILAQPYVREADILWEKRIWRELDTREKMNLAFRTPEPLINLLIEAIYAGELTAYSTIDDKFTTPLSIAEIDELLAASDTIEVMHPETYEITFKVVKNELNSDDIIKYRIKEVWYFDSKYSTLKVRILGIAPIRYVYDNRQNFLYEQPLFWIYYPHARPILHRQRVFMPGGNDNSLVSWYNLFEMRFFSSFIVKESNIHDRRLQDYLSGRDLLIEAERIKQEIFNFEQDLWSY
jgi:gliding motility associated protien GldN